MKIKEMRLTGTTDPAEQLYEAEHRKIARMAAAEGMVLLKNENQVLPLPAGKKLALYGAGASHMIKGGTGSGDVNERAVVGICQGLEEAGYEIVTKDWIAAYDQMYQDARESWRKEIWRKMDELEAAGFSDKMFDAYSSTAFSLPAGPVPEKAEADTDTAIYVLSRIAGEGMDRWNRGGDYQLSDEEHRILRTICLEYAHVIVLVNAGGLVELSFLDEFSNIEGLLYIVQPGMEGGRAVADVLSGKVTPSGKLTDSWAYYYHDYPSSAAFSHNDGDVDQERYEEGIYVGYRYFDTFQVPVRYGFGYGLSYTDFSLKVMGIEHFDLGTDHPEIGVKVQVTNTGDRYAGREVVQVYVACPQEKLAKEYRRLTGFQKTGLLAPGQMEEVVVRFPLSAAASYCEQLPGWVLEAGSYGIFAGNSLETARLCGSLELSGDIVLERTENVCPLRESLEEIKPDKEMLLQRRQEWKTGDYPVIHIQEWDVTGRTVSYGDGTGTISPKAKAFVDGLSTEQLILLAAGDPGKGQGSNLGSAGFSVPGSAAQTNACAAEQGLASIVLADGPAGLRLSRWYPVKDGKAESLPFEMALENGYLCRKEIEVSGEVRYQYCTAFPVGTLLAQTWDPEILYQVGEAVAEEMERFQVTLWLAPGMNIHRNPLCGRNFEYYSEDPCLTGIMAAAMTGGVQSRKGCGVTIKHYACNNQEDNRMGTDSILSERTLREIYLKGFEIAVKKAHPMSIMTSYNKINGIHAANCYDICTKTAREEWGFDGVIMTDWTTTHNGPECTASGCMRAGNDLVMPGIPQDHENMRRELEEGSLKLDELKRSIGHLADVVFRSNWYE